MSTFSPNLDLELVARGGDVGTWDTPTNSNWGIVDLVVGGIATVPLNNSNVVLSAAQFQARNITFNSTLTGSVAITFPSTFTKDYEIQNLCTGSSNFVITLGTTAGGQVICCPPGITFDCFNDGANIKFKNLPPVGSYMDFAGSALPNWMTGCTMSPWLNCDGSPIPAQYTVLPVVLGSSLLPDSRGRARYTLAQGTGRITAGGNSIDGATLFAGGGTQSIAQTNLPSLNFPVSGITLTNGAASIFVNPGAPAGGSAGVQGNPAPPTTPCGSISVFTNVTVATQGSAASGGSGTIISSPGYVGGLTLIRAA